MDQQIIESVQSLISPKLTLLMKCFTFLGSKVFLTTLLIVSSVLMIWHKKRWEALFLVIALGGGALFNLGLKSFYQRERPSLHRLIEETGYSFPSGHSMSSFILYGMLGILCYMFLISRMPKITIVISTSIIILLVGTSRIYLGVHYPSDVLAGYAAGGVWLTLCLLGLRLVLDYRQLQRTSARR
ncbi:phosphatase PAP2 family protein [Paenibacillus sp. J2TS4]|uniref:phosphatase PAP2 family protein n=1 Tax=Paenibacillus sp. J2TS4 TaxID=2807194 RepID=UPI001B0AF274|nr:phosphatase PAP2 family protein [Paenibacillus sp. J2TS4]GIP31656.1 hypothetical protein J2TS4_08660 [Paenibacillus sp. J2TS4]